MLSKPSIIIAFSITLLLFAGCSTQSTLNTHWGSSFEASKVNQIANPEASENLDPVVGTRRAVCRENYGELSAGL